LEVGQLASEVGKVALGIELVYSDLSRQIAPLSRRIGTEMNRSLQGAFVDAARAAGFAGNRGIGGLSSRIAAFTPLVEQSTTALTGLGAAARGAGMRIAAMTGPIGIAIGALGGLIAVSAAASQEAIRYEATIGRLNMQLREGSRSYMDWARSMGLAKQTAADMGATYGTLLSSFIRDTNDLNNSVKQLVHATRVTASATGRSIDDVMERMRSGLLGNTEAIEDLGVFVNVAMIESTNAFRRFAGDKSWDQLTFQQQQQIRLAAILEQVYARYGDQIQNNVMTKQERLTEQLKDIKLHFSQMWVPIYDAVLPALTRLAEGISWLTEQIARFIYWLRGWNYDEMTRGTDRATDAIDRQTDSFDELGKSAKKARNELASFDELNLIGFGDGSGAGGGGGAGGGIPIPQPPGRTGPSEWPMPEVPPLPRMRLEFDPPHPPDAGIGAVAEAVTATMQQLIARMREQWRQGLEGLRTGVVYATPAVVAAWQTILETIRVNTQTALAAVGMEWQTALASMYESIAAVRPAIESEWGMIQLAGTLTAAAMAEVAAAWGQRLAEMLNALVTTRPLIETEWSLIQNAAQFTITTLADVAAAWGQRLAEMLKSLNAHRPLLENGWVLIRQAARLTVTTLADVAAAWKQRLSEMLNNLNAYRPLLENGWWLVRNAIRLTIPALTDTQTAWQTAMQAMAASVTQMAATVSTQVANVLNAIDRLKSAFSIDIKLPSVSNVLPSADAFQKTFQNLFGSQNIQAGLDILKKEWNKPENQAGLTIMGLLSGGGVAAKGAQAGVKGLLEMLKGMGIAVPAFAAGGVVSGPTLAMVGEYPGAGGNPEVIAPLDRLESMLGGANHEVVEALYQLIDLMQEYVRRPVILEANGTQLAKAVDAARDDRIRRAGRTLGLT
jgi:hypothetical protein